jgi:nucleotide-binding universal stress UspA family protein
VFAGKSWEVLRAMAVDESADLIAVGSHGDRRLAGIVRGSTATELLHDAPCSTLVARAAIDPGRFPSSVVVGVDGSTESFAGLDLAKELVTASGGAAGGRALIASGANVDIGDLEGPAAPLAVARRSVGPIKVLIEASGACDLVILGARGLTGHRALGSVSERVAHRADCSVLVVRPSD